MQSPNFKPPLVVILGPTAVGKTQLAIDLAKKVDAEIVSADSRLFYRGMDIGTAKPTSEEMSQVVHHLVDVALPHEVLSLALFQRAAKRAIDEIHARGHLPLLVGGTGQYIRSITEGWNPPATVPDPQLRKVLENWAKEISPLGLHNRLAVVDPDAAGSIDPRNLRRTIRALEVIFSSGMRFSDQKRRSVPPYNVFQIGLYRSRDELYARIDQRIDKMIQQGFIAEVQSLMKQGYGPNLPTMSAIGYQEIYRYLQGELDLEEAITLMKRRTRAFVRRQANWFKMSDPLIHWYPAGVVSIEKLATEIKRWFGSRR